jgi:threonylcarbamoyladenosine tRNA methylthiotransferase MtaB
VGGLLESADARTADVVILNTCSVTAEADRSARAYLRRLRRNNPAARVIFTGCYAQRAPQEVASLDGVSLVVGNSHKSMIVDSVVEAALGSPPRPSPAMGRPAADFVPVDRLVGADSAAPIWHDPLFAHSELSALPFADDARQTRPNLKIQDGCGNRCSFCIIPLTRGPSRSVSRAECLRAVAAFVASGGKELVLSGINLGRWGRDQPAEGRLEDLVAAILEETALPRLRISSVEPMDWSPALISLFRLYANGDRPRLARHAHLPLQSGSDTVLRAMHRRYRPWHYAERVQQIHAAAPAAAIGADVMIGFPGETDALFQQTYDFLEALPLTYLHLFPFSARPGTPAFALHRERPVPGEAVNLRKESLQRLIRRKNADFRRQFVGSMLSVVTLAGDRSTRTSALSDNFLKVAVAGNLPANELLEVRISSTSADGLLGSPILAS